MSSKWEAGRLLEKTHVYFSTKLPWGGCSVWNTNIKSASSSSWSQLFDEWPQHKVLKKITYYFLYKCTLEIVWICLIVNKKFYNNIQFFYYPACEMHTFPSLKVQGRIQEFWLGGGLDFSFKAWGLGAALKPPVGPGQHPGGGPGGKTPGSSLILVILGVIVNHIVSPQRWSYTLS